VVSLRRAHTSRRLQRQQKISLEVNLEKNRHRPSWFQINDAFNNLPGCRFSPVSQNVLQILLRGCFQRRCVGSIERRSDNVEIGMLISHRSSDVAVSHRLHNRRQIANIGEHPRSNVVPGTIHDEFLRDLSLSPSAPELLAQVCEVTTLRIPRLKSKSPPIAPRHKTALCRPPTVHMSRLCWLF
jgi:hypothetical protein